MTSLSYNHSLILKELGFDKSTYMYYEIGRPNIEQMDQYVDYDHIPAPEYLDAFEFLLGLANRGLGFDEIIITIPKYELIHINHDRDTPEEVIAEGKEECVIKLISIINNK